ncbi:hypothetical protein H4R34_001053 [Dimargaris verticillata]|uniref:Uncharacterized protein n=1 Tax=Dimargaris verticillata TaxID=2761393 RepID=A0A9W8EEU9_9FUNG|nr:hypothetical protein H4R34_001053 [Dimargaris verticillata]
MIVSGKRVVAVVLGGLSLWVAIARAQPLSVSSQELSSLGEQPSSTVDWVRHGNDPNDLAEFRHNVGLLPNGSLDLRSNHFDTDRLRQILGYIELDMGQTTDLFRRYFGKRMDTTYPQDADSLSTAYPDLFQHYQLAMPSVASQIRQDLQSIGYYRPRKLSGIHSGLYKLVSQGHWPEVNGYFQAFFHELTSPELADQLQQLVTALKEPSSSQPEVAGLVPSRPGSSCIVANQVQRLCMYTLWVNAIGQQSSSQLQYYLGNTLAFVTIPRLIGKLIAMKQYHQMLIFLDTIDQLPQLSQYGNAHTANSANYYEVALFGLTSAEVPLTNLANMLAQLQQQGNVPVVLLYRCMERHLWDAPNRATLASTFDITTSPSPDEASRYYLEHPDECLPVEGRVERGFYVGTKELFIHEYPYSAAF